MIVRPLEGVSMAPSLAAREERCVDAVTEVVRD